MPIENPPHDLLPVGFKPRDGTAYQVQDGDDWYSVAKKKKVYVQDLIWFNFHTELNQLVSAPPDRMQQGHAGSPELDVQLERAAGDHLCSAAEVAPGPQAPPGDLEGG
jgi:hypothetical protein